MSGYLCELRTHFLDVRPTPTDGNMRFVSISTDITKCLPEAESGTLCIQHWRMSSWVLRFAWVILGFTGNMYITIWCETFNRLLFFLPTYWLATGWLRQYLNWCVPLVSLLLHNSYAIKCDQCTQHTRNETEKTTKFGTSLVNRCQYLLMKDDLEIVSLFFSIGDSGWKVHPMHKTPINGILTFRNICPFYWIHLIDIFFTDLSKADKYWTSIEITNIWWHFRWAGRKKKILWVLFFVMHRTISSAYSA